MSSPKSAAKVLTRIGFGLTLLLMGIAHYLKMDSFLSLMSEGYLGTPLEFLGPVLAYVIPALMIVGGFLYTIGCFRTVAAWAAGLALVIFPASMMLKAVVSPDIEPTSVMPFVVYGIAWLILYKMVSRGCCGSKCATSCGVCPCGTANCACPAPGAGCPACNHSPCDCKKPDVIVGEPKPMGSVAAKSSAPAKAWSPTKTAVKPVPAKKPASAKKAAPKKAGGMAA
jgi:uncharacterized membrane protein YphA (DoxX/SURF4 family)